MLKLEDLAALFEKHSEAASAHVKEFSLGGRFFSFNSQPFIMGVINLSADSWYRESVCLTAAQAVRRANVLHAQGADIIDVGAESTLAYALHMDPTAQIHKVPPVLTALRAANILVSVETYQLEVARACLDAGANILNFTGNE